MFFYAPDFLRKREGSSVLSFCWNIRILILIIVVGFHGVLSAEENALLEFIDNDSRGGWLKGDLIFSVPDKAILTNSSGQIGKFELYWGNNPHQRLGMFRPIVVFPPAESGSRMKIEFKDTRIPQSATHFLLYFRDENGEETEVFSLTLVDKGVPHSKPQEIFFEQTAKEGNRVQGEIRITRAWDERNVSHYAVYWGEGPETVLRAQPPVAVIEKRSWYGSLSVQLQAPWRLIPLKEQIDILLPPEATHLIVFSRNTEGQMSEGISFELEGVQAEDKKPAQKMQLRKFPTDSGMIGGVLSLERIEDEVGSGLYLFYWGKDEQTRLENHPPISQIEIKMFRDGLTDKEIQVTTLSTMDQELRVKPEGKTTRGIIYEFPENTLIPPNATHILAFTQQKFWFQDDVERRLKGPIASVSIKDPEGREKKNKIKSNIKAGLENFSIKQFKKKSVISRAKKENFENEIQEKEIKKAQDWRISEYRGLGLGLSFSGLNGVAIFYDYNLENDRQLHYLLELTGPQVGSTFKALRLTEESTDMQSIAKSGSGNSLEIGRTLVSATYRWFVDESLIWGITEGFYYGAGGGFGYATLNYQGKDTSAVASISGDTEIFDSTATDYRHSATAYGIFAVLDAGWQGLENYYFQFSLQPSIYIFYKDSFEKSSIPVNPNQRSTVEYRWLKAQDLTRVLFGFGVFF